MSNTAKGLFAAIVLLVLGPPAFGSEAAAGQGLVVFHRADVLKARAVRFNIEMDGVPIGQLPAGEELRVPVDPGTYMFTVRAPSWDGMDYLSLTVEAGKTYSIEGEVLWGYPVGRPKFSDVVESGIAVPQGTTATAPAESVAAAAMPAPGPSPAPVRNAANSSDAGRLGLRNFAGNWHMEMWSLAADGRKLEGKGRATGEMFGDYSVRISVNEFLAPDLPDATGGGLVTMSSHPERGLSLETDLPVADKKLILSGQFQGGKYVYYLVGGGGETVTGIPRASVRIEVESIVRDSWVAAPDASVEGQTVQVQSTRFTRQ